MHELDPEAEVVRNLSQCNGPLKENLTPADEEASSFSYRSIQAMIFDVGKIRTNYWRCGGKLLESN